MGIGTGLDLLRMRTLDLTLHAWDLARSLGLDETVDPDLAGHLLGSGLGLVEDPRGRGLYAPVGNEARHPSTPQGELLRLTGRA